jgi:YVTN family beta-propeller protein
MRLITRRRCRGWLRPVWLLLGMLLTALPLSAGRVLIYSVNTPGSTVDVIDSATNKVVQVIKSIELPHDVAFAADGSRVYISDESESVLDAVDQKTGEIIKKVPLSGHPNTLVATSDGRRVYVAIREEPGGLDVIDTSSLERVKSIPKTGPVHDVYLTPDGKYVVAGSEEAKQVTVVDVQTEQPVWEIKLDNPVRTMAFERNSDGSTRRIFVSTSFLHGFEVVDFAERKVVANIKLPDEPSGGMTPDPHSPSHGLGVAPDNRTLWVNSKHADAVFVYSLPDLKLLGYARSGVRPHWVTFSPDSKRIYVCNTAENTVSAIDTKTRKEVARIPTGEGPKRIETLVLP